MLQRPKPPKEARQDVIDDINRMRIDPDRLIVTLMSHFTTLDLIGIRDQLRKEKEK